MAARSDQGAAALGFSSSAPRLSIPRLPEASRRRPRADAARKTVGEFLEQWLSDVARHSLRPRTYEGYTIIVRRHLEPELGGTPLAELSPRDLQAFLARKSTSGASPRTVQYVHAVLRRALRDAERWGLVSRNVATLVTPPRVPHPTIEPFPLDEVSRLLMAIRGDRLEALYVTSLGIGLRLGEALGLLWEAVDLDAGSLVVRNGLQRIEGRLALVEPKSARSRRTIVLPESVRRALADHHAQQTAEREATGRRWQDTGLVFTTTRGTAIDPRNVTRMFHRHLQQANLPHRRFHDLRHTCATFLLSKGVHPRIVMDILGHSSIAVTMDIYSHVMPGPQQEAAASMEALLQELNLGSTEMSNAPARSQQERF